MSTRILLPRLALALLVFTWGAGAIAAEEDVFFDLSPPNSVGFAATGDSDGGRTGNLAFSATLPKDWVLYGSAGRRTIDADGENVQLGNWFFGFNTDPMAYWYFELSLDQQFHRGLYADTGLETRVYYQPESGFMSGGSLGLILGARRFRFKPEESINGRSEIDIGSSSVGLALDFPFAKRWLVKLEVQRYNYPEQIKALGEDLATLVVPNDTLNYAFGISESSSRLYLSYSAPFAKKLKPTFALDLSAAKSAVDQSTWGSAGLVGIGRLTRNWSLTLSYYTARTIVNAQRSEPTRTVGAAVMYSWK